MIALYDFVTGPLVWAAFLIFAGGTIYRIVSMAVLAREKDLVVYSYMDPYYALRSIFHWVVPYASTNMKMKPIFTFISFAFHISLLLAPIFLLAHVVLVEDAWGMSWWMLSDTVADVLTVAVIAACVFFAFRRVYQRDVRYLTSPSDFVILALVAAPFVTGFWAQHQWAGFRFMTILHIVSGEMLLAAIPFTRLIHMFMFPFTRGYMGSEFGAVRHAKDW
ncbi:MAG: TmcC family electron transfer complex membrane anchor subunit [Pseudomonadota bacterium]